MPVTGSPTSAEVLMAVAIDPGLLSYLSASSERRSKDGKAGDDIRTYLATYRGRHFERLGGGGDRLEVRDRFTGEDLVAVTALSVEVPIQAAVAILDARAADYSALLAQVPADVDLWDAEDDLVGPGSAADRLWSEIEGLAGVGWVTTGKLLARKRPRLLPVYDNVVKEVLARRDGEEFWRPLRDLLRSDEIMVGVGPGSVLKDHLCQLAKGPGEGTITPLRAFDIATWMHGKRRSA